MLRMVTTLATELAKYGARMLVWPGVNVIGPAEPREAVAAFVMPVMPRLPLKTCIVPIAVVADSTMKLQTAIAEPTLAVPEPSAPEVNRSASRLVPELPNLKVGVR